MTNPISKAIVKAAVAMGYGKKSDYKGSSVADVLEKFAAIAKDKGSSGDGLFVVGGTVSGTTVTLDKTAGQIYTAMNSKTVLIALENVAEGIDSFRSFLYTATLGTEGGNQYYAFNGYGIATTPVTSDGYPRFSL